jgi:hypothetical protein
LALGLNILISLGLALYHGNEFSATLLPVLYYTVMTLVFFWIMDPPGRGSGFFRVRTVYRLILGAVLGGLTFLFAQYTNLNSPGFSALLRSQAEMLSSLYINSSGADAARRSFLETFITPERILEILKLAALRGGAVASSLFLFFISRQISHSLARMIRRIPSPGQGGGLRGFYAPPRSIWALSFSLLAILVFRFLHIEVLETIFWNVLTICVMLFLAQGGGIVLFALTHKMMPPLVRLVLNVLVILLIFSPGINAFALGALVLLGIAENWVPFRAPKPGGTSSTPGM